MELYFEFIADVGIGYCESANFDVMSHNMAVACSGWIAHERRLTKAESVETEWRATETRETETIRAQSPTSSKAIAPFLHGAYACSLRLTVRLSFSPAP